jgi:hypothetical protein
LRTPKIWLGPTLVPAELPHDDADPDAAAGKLKHGLDDDEDNPQSGTDAKKQKRAHDGTGVRVWKLDR